jgi:hypothetical protein
MAPSQISKPGHLSKGNALADIQITPIAATTTLHNLFIDKRSF